MAPKDPTGRHGIRRAEPAKVNLGVGGYHDNGKVPMLASAVRSCGRDRSERRAQFSPAERGIAATTAVQELFSGNRALKTGKSTIQTSGGSGG